MAYIRISIARPLRGQDALVLEVMQKVAAIAAGQAGHIESYVARSHDGTGDVARITIYDSEAAAEHSATDATMMALRSDLLRIAEPQHEERAFFSV